MDKKEILARSRAENAAGDEREQSLVQKSRIFGFRCLWLSYFLIFFIFEITTNPFPARLPCIAGALQSAFIDISYIIKKSKWRFLRVFHKILTKRCEGFSLLLRQSL